MRCAESPSPVVSLPCQWSSPHVPPSYSAPFSASILLPFCLRMDLDCSIVPELNDEPASALMDRDAEVHQYEAGTLVGSFVKHRQGWRGPLAYVSSSACASPSFKDLGRACSMRIEGVGLAVTMGLTGAMVRMDLPRRRPRSPPV